MEDLTSRFIALPHFINGAVVEVSHEVRLRNEETGYIVFEGADRFPAISLHFVNNLHEMATRFKCIDINVPVLEFSASIRRIEKQASHFCRLFLQQTAASS